MENRLETFVFVCSAYTNWGQTERQPVLDRWIVGSPARQRIVNRIAVSSLDHSSSVRALCYCFSVLFLERNEPPPCIDAAVNCYSMPLVINFQSFPGPKLRCSHNYNSTLWSILHTTSCNWYYTGWLVTGGTSGKGVILREKRSRKYRINIFRLRLCFRENRLWIFARYACTLSRLVITDLTVDRCLDEYYRSLSLFLPWRKIFILYFRLLFSRRIIPFPLVAPATNHPVYTVADGSIRTRKY